MKIFHKSVLWAVVVMGCGRLGATDLFLLNKTQEPVYYEFFYLTFKQDALKVADLLTPFPAIVGAIDKKKREEIRKELGGSRAQGFLASNEVVHIPAYRVDSLWLRPDKDPASFYDQSRIVSMAADKRLVAACKNMNMKEKDCFGTTMKGLGSNLVGQEDAKKKLLFHQTGLANIARPIVLVITKDPSSGGYIVTELAHTWELPVGQRKPIKFFDDVKALSTLPNVPAL